MEEGALEEEALEEEAAVQARSAEGAVMEMGDERTNGATEGEGSETDEMEELPDEVEKVERAGGWEEAEEVEEAMATGAKRMELEPASWDDEEVGLETGHQNLGPMGRNKLTTRCATCLHSHQPPPCPATHIRARGRRFIQEFFEYEGLYKMMTRSARRRADLVGAIRAVQVFGLRRCTHHAPATLRGVSG